MRHQSYNGLQSDIREMETPAIETWKNEYSDKDYTIEITTPEFTAICPKTGLPDFGTIQITYIPDEQCVELKSLKEYLLFYRDVGIFHEHVLSKPDGDSERRANSTTAYTFHIRPSHDC